MSGGENYFAGALFFSLMTFGAFLKIDGFEGLAVGAAFAFLSGFFIRRAFVQITENKEDDYYRLELQIQELRKSHDKPAENSIDKNLRDIDKHLAALENISETNAAIGAIVKKIEDNTSEIYLTLKALSDFIPAEIQKLHQVNDKPAENSIDKNLQDITKHLAALENISETDAAIGAMVKKIEDNTSETYLKLKALSDFIPAEIQKLHANEEANRQTVTTATNILQTLDTLLKNPDFQKQISELSQVNAEIFNQNKNLLDAVNTLKIINENLLKSTVNLRAVFEDIENISDDTN